MTYTEYDNVQIENSNMYCKLPIDLMMRNMNFSQYYSWIYQNEEGGTRNLTSIASGELIELANFYNIYTTDDYGVIGVGDYIYGVESGDSSANIYEYRISKHTKKIVNVSHTYGLYTDGVILSYIEPHKILAVVTYDEMPCQVYIADFETNTFTLELTCDPDKDYEIDQLFVTEKNGKTWLFVTVWSDGWGIHYKNYTDNGAWNVSYYKPTMWDDFAYWNSYTWYTIGNDYLAVYGTMDADDPDGSTPCRIQIITFNTETFAWQESAFLESYHFTSLYSKWVYTENTGIVTSNVSTKKLYGQYYGFSDYNSTTRIYTHLFIQWFEYDPSTNTITNLYSQGWEAYDVNIYGAFKSFPFSTKNSVYMYHNVDDNVYSLPDMNIVGNMAGSWSYSSYTILDGSGIVYVEFYTDGPTLRAVDFNANELFRWTIPTCDGFNVIAAGNGVVVECYTYIGGHYPTYSYNEKIYLLT